MESKYCAFLLFSFGRVPFTGDPRINGAISLRDGICLIQDGMCCGAHAVGVLFVTQMRK